MSELSRRSLLAGAVASAAVLPFAGTEPRSEGLFEQLRAEYLPHLRPFWKEEIEGPIEAGADSHAREAMQAGMTVLRRARLAAGLTMAECAKRTGKSFWTWSQFENGHEQPDFAEGMVICELLKIEPEALAEQFGYERA